MIEQILDHVGVNTHFGYSGTPYTDRTEAVIAKLQELGVRHIRDGGAVQHTGPSGTDYRYMDKIMARLKAQPCDILYALQPHEIYDKSVPVYPYLKNYKDVEIPYLTDRLGNKVVAWEGINEPDLKLAPERDWVHNVIDLQAAIMQFQDNREILTPPIGHPWKPETYAALGFGLWENLGDVAAAHFYAGTLPPNNAALANNFTLLRRYALDMPVWVTECGYDTAGLNSSVTEQQQADYLLQTIFTHISLGIRRSYIYELVDQKPTAGRETRLGLLRYDLTEKPAFTMLKNLLRGLRA